MSSNTRAMLTVFSLIVKVNQIMFDTVTQDGVTKSQKGCSVSTTSGTGIDGVILSVTRHYVMPNGRQKIMRLDAHGKRFETSKMAFAYALERGYLQLYFTSPDLRAKHKANGTERMREVMNHR